jgi:hypothetical protein
LTDYRLDRLSPRLFEHVIQALASGAITSTITPFGDGPDGGREATFEGPTDYGPASAPWNGYGIIQCKYKVRAATPKQDAEWACRELRKELKQYSRAKNPRPVPEYYVFATNVVLSPGDGGGKDAVLKVLQEFASKYGLKGIDLWDYDKLRVLIDRDESVRTSYMAWILPSDVIVELCKMLKGSQQDYYKIILRYLQRELLADQYAQLEQAGHSADEAIPLAQVFIDLPTTARPSSGSQAASHSSQDESPRFVAHIVQEAGHSLRVLNSDAAPNNIERQVNLAKHIRPGRYVLIGGPGQGKTTIAQYICQMFRYALLADVPPERLEPSVTAALEDLSAHSDEQGLTTPAARRLPFRVVLSDFAKSLASGETDSLMGYLATRLCAKSHIKISAEEIERVLSEYPSVIVLDGLDEVPASTNRDEVVSAVTNFSIDVTTGNLDVFLIATTRPQGYNEEFSPRYYAHRYLSPLSASDAIRYGTRLAKTRFGSNEDRFTKVVTRLRRALSKVATARLMETPLQVTILTLLVDRMGDPPEERWSLFKEYYQLIYERETERDIPSVAVLKSHRTDVDVIHRRVGLALQLESERSGGTDARLTLIQFGSLIDAYLREEGHEGESLESLKAAIIDAAANRLVFLVGLEAEQVGFEIRSLQEFMAAEGLTDGTDGDIEDRLRAIAATSHWRNVFLFAAGKCFSERRHLRAAIQAICAELNEDPDRESLRVLHSGSELALDLLEDGPARKVPMTAGPMTRLAIQLLGTPFREVARLAGICEEGTKYIFAEDLRWRLLEHPAGRTPGVWGCLAALIDRFGSEFELLGREAIAQKPLSIAEFNEAAEVTPQNSKWLSDLLFDFVVQNRPVLEIGLIYSESDDDDESLIDNASAIWPPSSYPSWLSWYAHLSTMVWAIQHTSSMRIMIDGKQEYSTVFNRTNCEVDVFLAVPKDLPTGPLWDTLGSIGAFCKSPSASSLSAALRAVESGTEFLGHWDMLRFQLPWPLGETLSAASESSHSRVAELVESGAYGDTSSWIEAERKWIEGVALDELAAQKNLARSADDPELYLFPFRCASWLARGFGGKARGVIFPNVAQAYAMSESDLVRRFLAEIQVGSLGAPARPGASTSIELYRSNIDDMVFDVVQRSQYVSQPFYWFIEALDLRNRRWSDMFADLRSIRSETHRQKTTNERVVVACGSTLREDRTLRGLIVPMAAALSSMSRAQQLAAQWRVDISDQDTPVVRASGLVISLLAGARVSSLADHITRVAADDWRYLGRLVEAIVSRDLSYDDEVGELMALAHIAGGDGRVQLWYSLHRNFSRRRSNLLDGQMWGELHFPLSMRGVLGSG